MSTLPSGSVPVTDGRPKGTLPPGSVAIKGSSAAPTQSADVQGMPLNTDPLPIPEDRKFSAMTREGPVERIVSAPPWKVSSAERGVSISDGLSGDIRKDLGFSPNETFSLAYIQKKLSEKYGIDELDPNSMPLARISPQGKIEYYHKDSGRYAVVDENGLSIADMKELYGPSITFGAEMGGTAVGMVPAASPTTVASLPYTTTVGGAVGAFYGEYMRLKHGKDIGVHDLPQEQMFEEAQRVALWSLGGGAAGEVGMKMLSGLRRFIAPEGVSAKHADDLLKKLDDPEVQAELLEINRQLDNNSFKLDVAQQTGDVDALKLKDAALRSESVNTDAGGESYASRVAARESENEAALTEYLNAKTGVDDLASVDSEVSGQQVQEALRLRRQEIEGEYAAYTESAMADSRSVLDDLADFDQTAAGQQAREIAQTHANSLKGVKNKSYSDYEASIGQVNGTYTSDVRVPVSKEILARQKEVDKLIKESVINRQVSGTNALDVQSGTIDLAVLDDNIKTLRSAARRANSGVGEVGFDANKAIDSADALAKMRDDFLAENYPEQYSKLVRAEADNTVYKDFMSNKALKSIINQDGSIGDISIFRSVFTHNNGEAMSELVAVAKTQPGSLSKLQLMMLKFYRENYTVDGVPDMKLHQRFLDKHGLVLNSLFDGDDRVTVLGGLASRVSRSIAEEERVVKELDGTVLGRFARANGKGVNPESLGRNIFTEGVSRKDIREVVSILDNAPNSAELKVAWQKSVGSEIYRRIATDQVIDPKALGTLLKNERREIARAMGQEYLDGLDTLYKALQMAGRNESGKALDKTGFLGMLARATINPPLTRGGRFQTLVQMIRWKAANQAVIDALNDPQVLRTIVYNAERDITDKHVVRTLSQIGAANFAMMDDGTLPEEYRGNE